MDQKRDVRSTWLKLFDAGLDADTWGQGLEAIDEYEKLIRSIDTKVPQLSSLSINDKSLIGKIRLSVQLRVDALNEKCKKKPLPLNDLKNVVSVLHGLFTTFSSYDKKFPIKLEDYAESLTGTTSTKTSEGVGSLLAPLKVTKSGTTTLSIFVEKIGLKDAKSYIEGRITVTLCDKEGRNVGPFQTTPPSTRSEGNWIHFGHNIHIQTSLDNIPSHYAIILEFKHWKPKKKKLSTRCWSLMEHDEFSEPGLRQLELYTKPTDFSRRNIRLHSVKDYALLFVNVVFHKH